MTDFRKLAEKLADRLYDANVTLAYLNEKNFIDDEEPIMKTWEILADARNEIQEPKPDDTEKLLFLIRVLKEYAEEKHCYEREAFYDVYDERELGETVEHAEEYAEIHFARTLLEQIDETFEYPSCERK
jgi:hypothetical protein